MTTDGADKVNNGRSLNAFAKAGGALAAVIGLVAILGWITGHPLLAGFGSPVPMAPSTALLFMLYGSAVFLHLRNPLSKTLYRLAVSVGFAGALAAAVLFFLSYLGIHLSIEHLGIPISGTANGVPIGHISPLTAFCFVLAGISFAATLASTGDLPGRATAGFWLACLILLISFVLLLAYLFGTPILYGLSLRYAHPLRWTLYPSGIVNIPGFHCSGDVSITACRTPDEVKQCEDRSSR